METKVWDLRPYRDDLTRYPDLSEIQQIYRQGGLIALPTETVYGLGANALDESAVRHVYEAKGRPSDNPLIIHVHSEDQLNDFVSHIPADTQKLMDAFWPGPISFILPLKKGYLCDRVTGGLDSIAVRMPSHPIGRQVLQLVDLPIAAPSANLSGKPSPTTFDHVYHDLNGRIDGIIQGDQSEEGLESTVLDCTQVPFRIARPGAITAEMIESVIDQQVERMGMVDQDRPIAPGMKYRHYAPETPVTIVSTLEEAQALQGDKEWSQTALIFPDNYERDIPDQASFISLCQNEQDIKGANHNLYHVLHQLDARSDINQAYIFGFKPSDETAAIMNRMEKAATPSVAKGE
ncbi:L-threonylcarbamoyladenylate synthase [Staphylococcus auricularis]|uniref:L-threonylcarbamoyladenylate synthase n=1 Tax=Staphylococcus auricularis TaxID=29379 RepID=UPI000D1BF402|nr:L-threonylcarbamoyladenylate synthase [Staphylococcus auricularis]MCE5039271.1 threonylcarbamoyl-AMP synthase [Staphylococcus auricularis]MEB6570979.1 L-threonylcarbamoyladenylate synthase [Staphylococcus auricularis]PTH26708.1 threonylcarbamoyl-AMP synthase [Staphylococcus auricularis]